MATPPNDGMTWERMRKAFASGQMYVGVDQGRTPWFTVHGGRSCGKTAQQKANQERARAEFAAGAVSLVSCVDCGTWHDPEPRPDLVQMPIQPAHRCAPCQAKADRMHGIHVAGAAWVS